MQSHVFGDGEFGNETLVGGTVCNRKGNVHGIPFTPPAFPPHLSLARTIKPAHQPEQAGLSAPIGAQERKELSGRQFVAYVSKYPLATMPLAHLL
jgi:hypothetical protein